MQAPSSSQGEGLRRDQKLRRRADYLCCYRQGRRRHGSLVTLHFHPNLESNPRLGITASRKVGKAVIRQKAKRRVREIFRRWPGRSSLPAVDVVVHLKPAVASAQFCQLESELHRLLSGLDDSAIHRGRVRHSSRRRSKNGRSKNMRSANRTR